MTQEIQNYSVGDMMDWVKQAKKALKGIENKSFKTSCRFKFNPTAYDNNGIPIDTVTDVTLLLNIAAFLIEKEEYYQKAIKHFGIGNEEFSVPVFKWNGYNKEDWLEDINLRLQLIHHKERLDMLKEAENELKQLMDKNDRMDQLAKRLGFSK